MITATLPVPSVLSPVSPCPDHPATVFRRSKASTARGSCPVDSRSYQMSPVEVKP